MSLDTIKRAPNAIQVNGAVLFVRDPEAAAGTLFANYRRLGGLGSFTLPAEAGSTTETALMDGAISFANVAGVGNISGAVGALNAGPIHELMEEKAISGGQVQVSIIRPATGVVDLRNFPAANVGLVDQSADPKRILIGEANKRAIVKAQVREGMIVAIDKDLGTAAALAYPGAVQPYTGAAADAAAEGNWQGVLEVHEDGEWIDVAPGYAADVDATADAGAIYIRNPGRSYVGITGAVNQWDRGDHQAGGGITSNLQIVPSAQLAVFRVEHKLESEFAYAANTGYGATL